MDRATNRSHRANQSNQSQIQPSESKSQLTMQGNAKNSAQRNNANQSQSLRIMRPIVSQKTMFNLKNSQTTSTTQDSIDIKNFTGLSISGRSASHSNALPSTRPKLTKEIFSQICSAQSQSDLLNCMRIVGMHSLQDLCEMKLKNNYTVLMLVAQTGNAKLVSLLLHSVADPQ